MSAFGLIFSGKVNHLDYAETSRGNIAEAMRWLQLAEQLGSPPVYRLAQMALAYSLAGRFNAATRIFAEFEKQATRVGTGQRIEPAVNERGTLDQTPLVTLAGNSWGDTELEKPEFRALLYGLLIDEQGFRIPSPRVPDSPPPDPLQWRVSRAANALYSD